MRGGATWVWRPEDADVGFAIAQGVSEAFVDVPAAGPDAAGRHVAARFRRAGVRMAALGSGAEWVDDPPLAAAWARRAAASGLFAGVHLDVEPWARPDWDAREEGLLAALGDVIRAVRDATGLPVDVDLPPWLAARHPSAFTALGGAASAVTLLAYRDTAAGILDVSSAARRALAAARRRYRIGVDTSAGREPGTSFERAGRAALAAELSAVARTLDADPLFDGVAVHDAAGWRALA